MHGGTGIHGAQGRAGMGGHIHAEHFVRESLTDVLDMPEVEFDGPEFLQSHQQPASFRAGDVLLTEQLDVTLLLENR